MTVVEAIALLRTDLGDSSGDLLADNDLLRALTRAVTAVNRDLGRSYVIEGDEIIPDPDSSDEFDLILLRAHAFCCSMLRSAASVNFAFSSADKKVTEHV